MIIEEILANPQRAEFLYRYSDREIVVSGGIVYTKQKTSDTDFKQLDRSAQSWRLSDADSAVPVEEFKSLEELPVKKVRMTRAKQIDPAEVMKMKRRRIKNEAIAKKFGVSISTIQKMTAKVRK